MTVFIEFQFVKKGSLRELFGNSLWFQLPRWLAEGYEIARKKNSPSNRK